jgi:hypothetical protein
LIAALTRLTPHGKNTKFKAAAADFRFGSSFFDTLVLTLTRL